MAMLNQLFNRGLLGAKCKTCLTLAISRIKLLQNKRDVQLKLMRKEIAEFLQAGQEAIARIRVEHIIREQNTWEAYEILELFCEFVLARVPILESQRECPTELREAVASIIFSAPRCSDLPDLLHVRNLFAAKYGKEFIAAASELRPDTSVNRTIIEKLSVSAPPADVKLKVLKAIALEYNVNWDSTKTEREFSKNPEDLLNGPKQIAAQHHKDSRLEVRKDWSADQSTAPLNGNQGEHYLQSPTLSSTSFVETGRAESSTRELNPKPTNEIKNLNPQSSDALQRARAAITAAERASAAARAAAELVNARFTSFKQEERKI
ncbi:Regulator of Vps4 activity in the MVB pathway protein [Perilla frutescens var. hirtella]|nr:Regulator of Vps4 activity in the MVB pathway protein [Perilla frutescens var. hirtella]KAH6815028.1 Regulator of Vps4 activity in the MVB pathway protein [Perilla frutescens var. frutescens]